MLRRTQGANPWRARFPSQPGCSAYGQVKRRFARPARVEGSVRERGRVIRGARHIWVSWPTVNGLQPGDTSAPQIGVQPLDEFAGLVLEEHNRAGLAFEGQRGAFRVHPAICEGRAMHFCCGPAISAQRNSSVASSKPARAKTFPASPSAVSAACLGQPRRAAPSCGCVGFALLLLPCRPLVSENIINEAGRGGRARPTVAAHALVRFEPARSGLAGQARSACRSVSACRGFRRSCCSRPQWRQSHPIIVPFSRAGRMWVRLAAASQDEVLGAWAGLG